MMVKKLKIDGHTLPSCLQKNYNNVVSPLTVKYLDNDEWVQSVFFFFYLSLQMAMHNFIPTT